MPNVILATPLPFLVTNLYTSYSKVDGDYQAEKLAEVIKNVPSGVKVTALCTDNCSTNKKSWRELRKRFPGSLTYGCVCHVLQLLGNDISKMPDFAETLKKANRIVTYFRIHLRSAGLASLRKLQLDLDAKESSLTLPAKTRWNSTLACVQSLQRNRQA